MKRKIFLLIAFALVLSLLLSVFSFAEGETPLPDEPPAEATETSPDGYSDVVLSFIDRLTTSTFWIEIAAVLTSLTGVFAIMRKYLKRTIDLIHAKADAETIKKLFKTASGEMSELVENRMAELSKRYAELESHINEQNEQLKTLETLLALFMTEAKIKPSARAEIMKMLTGIHTYTGTAAEIVEKAHEAIAAAESTEEKEDTPALDAIAETVKEDSEETVMSL